MKIVRSYCVILNDEERAAVLTRARGLQSDGGVTDEHFIEMIEQMLFDAFDEGMREPRVNT